MSLSATNETISLYLPAIPYLTSAPISASIPTNTLKFLMRLVVIVATYLLFRPQLERLFRQMLGKNDPAAPHTVQDLKSRMKELENERGKPIGGGRKVGVVTNTGTASGGQEQGLKTRRKA